MTGSGAVTVGPGRAALPEDAGSAPASAAPVRHSAGWLAGVAVGALVGLAGAVPLYRHAIRTDLQPSPVSGAPDVLVAHWSAPWVLAAAGAALVGLLLAVALVAELVRRRTDPVLVPEPIDFPPHQQTALDTEPAAHPVPAVLGDPDDVWRPPAPGTP